MKGDLGRSHCRLAGAGPAYGKLCCGGVRSASSPAFLPEPYPHHSPVDKRRQVLFSLYREKGAEVQGDAWFIQGHKANERQS